MGGLTSHLNFSIVFSILKYIYTIFVMEDYTMEDYYNEFVKDYDEQIKENIHYNKLFFDKLWTLAEDGLALAKVLGFINSFDNDESQVDESSKETYERFIKYWESEFEDD